MIEQFLGNMWVAYSIIIVLGLILGTLVLRPVLYFFEKGASKRNLIYLRELLEILKKLSPIFGIIIMLNSTHLYPFTIEFKASFVKFLKVLNTIVLTFIIGEVFIFVYDRYADAKSNIKAASLFHIVIRLFVYSVGLFVISSVLHYDIKTLLTALGVGGLAVALALQDTLSNLFSGMHILASKQLKPGDYIKIDSGHEGYVIDINWRNTEIKTLLSNVVIVPNSKISSSVLTNYFNIQKSLFFQVEIGVDYNSDLEQVERVALDEAEKLLATSASVPEDFKPKVRFSEFAESSINMKVWLATDTYENQYLIKHEFIKAVQKRFAKENINIPFPIRTIHMQNQG